MNPVLAREVKERMRGLRAFIALSVFLGLLTLTVWFVHQANDTTNQFSFDLERQTRLGRDLFEWLLTIMLVLLCFLVPGLTAGTIAGERERQTLTTLQVTLLRPRSILWGKVQAATAYLGLMIVASLPLFAVSYQLGGVNLTDAAKGIGAIIVIGILLATMVAAISGFAKRVQTATLMAYGFTALLCIGSGLAVGAGALIDQARGSDDVNPPAALVVVNPMVFLADFTSGNNVAIGNTPLRFVRQGTVRLYNRNDSWISMKDQPGFGDRGNDVILGNADDVRRGVPAWILSLTSMVVIAGSLFVLACRRLRTPAESER